MALNVALPFAVLGWLCMGASRGGWGVDDKRIPRWRGWLGVAACAIGTALFFLLPKVEIVAG
jgi:hypothetical protein